MVDVIIRDETPADFDAVRNLHFLAFSEESPGKITDDLRKSGDAVISLVAVRKQQIIGHVLFSKIAAPMRSLSLAPVGVHPDVQKTGIGSQLIRHGLERTQQEGWQAVFVLGSPKYYSRFGFNALSAKFYNSPYKGPSFMAILFDEEAPKSGELVFPAAFNEDIREHIARGY